MIGFKSQKLSAGIIPSKICHICSCAKVHAENPPDHVYPKNYKGSSKAIETDVALRLYKNVYACTNKCLFIKAIVVDDGFSLSALLKYQCTNSKERLHIEMPQPEWLLDPSH